MFQFHPEIYASLFEKIMGLFPDLEHLQNGDGRKSAPPGKRELSLEVVIRDKHTATVELAWYYTLGEEKRPDPEMEIRVDFQHRQAEALAFQNGLLFSHVYGEDACGRVTVDYNAKVNLNHNLNTWLSSLIVEGYALVPEQEKASA